MGRPWEDGTEHRLLQDALEQVELAERWGSATCGRSSTTSSRSTATPRRRRCSWPPAASARPASASATASCSPPRGSTIPPVSPNASPRSICFGRAGRLRQRRVLQRAELAGFQVDPARKRDAWLEGLETSLRCMRRCRSPASTASTSRCRPERGPQAVPAATSAGAGGVSRRETILLAASKGIGALTFGSIDPEEALNWVTEYERVLADGRPVGWAVNPEVACVTPMMLHHDEEVAIRRGVEGGNIFGYSLGHYYVFGTHRPGRTDVVGRVHPAPGRPGVRPRRRRRPRCGSNGSGPGSPPATRPGCAAASAPGAGPGVPAALRGGRRRPSDLRAPGGTKPPRAHHGITRVFGREVFPEFAERDPARAAAKAERLARSRGRLSPGRPRANSRASRRLRVPGDPAPVGGRQRSAEMRDWLDKFADDRGRGCHDPAAGIAG